MVDDWLQNTNGDIGKVVGIRNYAGTDPTLQGAYEVVMQYHENSLCYSDPKMLEAIRLTPEVLEKNGWFYKNGYWTKKGPVRLSWHEKDVTLIAGYWQVPSAVEYVHTLQNIIRLLGMADDVRL